MWYPGYHSPSCAGCEDNYHHVGPSVLSMKPSFCTFAGLCSGAFKWAADIDTDMLDASFAGLALPESAGASKQDDADCLLCIPHSLRGLLHQPHFPSDTTPVLVSVMPLHLEFTALAYLSQEPGLLDSLHSQDPLAAAAEYCSNPTSQVLAEPDRPIPFPFYTPHSTPVLNLRGAPAYGGSGVTCQCTPEPGPNLARASCRLETLWQRQPSAAHIHTVEYLPLSDDNFKSSPSAHSCFQHSSTPVSEYGASLHHVCIALARMSQCQCHSDSSAAKAMAAAGECCLGCVPASGLTLPVEAL